MGQALRDSLDRHPPDEATQNAAAHTDARATDNLVDRALLWIFPRNVLPNHMTIARFILTPVVLVLLYFELNGWAFGVFVVAVCTDFIDGAMARTRNQISRIGMLIDPIADKLLIGAVLAWVGYSSETPTATFVVIQVLLAFILLELIFTAVGVGVAKPGDRVKPANIFGKAKMVIQSIAVILFLIAGMFELDRVLTVSTYLLWLAILMAALSGAKHIRERLAGDRSTAEPPE
jgi:CDP-diacylglycerol---glycerol-3-phosphate 3-phosphatidyltransferase